MKKRFFPLLALAAALAAPAPGLAAAQDSAAPAFSSRDRNVLRAAVRDVASALKDAGLPSALPISVLHVAGDRQDYVTGLIKNAVTQAGLNYVEGRSDPMWGSIVDEIGWDEIITSQWLDDETIARFGKLQATRLLLYGQLILETTVDGRPRAELTLHVSNIETKQHIWGDTFLRVELPPPPPPIPDGNKPVIVREPLVYALDPVEALLSVQVVAKTADELDMALASRLLPIAEDELADRGFSVEDTPTPDILVTLSPSMDLFDRTGGSY